MALDLTALTAYIDEQQFDMATAALIGGRTAGFLTPQIGVKGETKINKMDVDVTMQDGSGCAWNASGDATFTQETIDAKQVKINMEFCPKDLNAYYWRTQMPAGTHQEALPFEAQFANYLVAKVQDSLETVIWNGNTATGTGNNAMFDGILKGAASFTDCNGTSGSFGSAISGAVDINNVVEAVERIYVEAPSAAVAQDDFRIYLGVDKFRTLAAAIMNGNGGASILSGGALQGSMDRADVDPLRIIMPGTNLEIVGVGGLNTADKVVGFSSSNVFLGMDLEADSTNIESWYSQDDRKFRVAMEWTMGVGVAYPAEVGKVIV
jgi:hypothetical protein|tara:strand:- start:763 stop:1728 length:966 start_codon:yes stop_codon:yes gene_type:complete